MIDDDATQQDFDKVVLDLLDMLDGKLPADKKIASGQCRRRLVSFTLPRGLPFSLYTTLLSFSLSSSLFIVLMEGLLPVSNSQAIS